jgi:hypothetical protein
MRIGRIPVAQTVFDGYQKRWPDASYLWAGARWPAAKQIIDNGFPLKLAPHIDHWRERWSGVICAP